MQSFHPDQPWTRGPDSISCWSHSSLTMKTLHLGWNATDPAVVTEGSAPKRTLTDVMILLEHLFLIKNKVHRVSWKNADAFLRFFVTVAFNGGVWQIKWKLASPWARHECCLKTANFICRLWGRTGLLTFITDNMSLENQFSLWETFKCRLFRLFTFK